MIDKLAEMHHFKEELKMAIIKYKPKFRLILRENLGPNKKREKEKREFT